MVVSRAIWFDRHVLHRIRESVVPARRPVQYLPGQQPIACPWFEDRERLRPAQCRPEPMAPAGNTPAKERVDVGARQEISVPSYTLSRPVVAMLWVVERQFHESLEADRSTIHLVDDDGNELWIAQRRRSRVQVDSHGASVARNRVEFSRPSSLRA